MAGPGDVASFPSVTGTSLRESHLRVCHTEMGAKKKDGRPGHCPFERGKGRKCPACIIEIRTGGGLLRMKAARRSWLNAINCANVQLAAV